MNAIAILLILLIAGLLIAFTADLGKVGVSISNIWHNITNTTSMSSSSDAVPPLNILQGENNET